jgi:hypothetical protein
MKQEFRYYVSNNRLTQSPAELLSIEAKSAAEVVELLKTAGCLPDGGEIWVHVLVQSSDDGTELGFESFRV